MIRSGYIYFCNVCERNVIKSTTLPSVKLLTKEELSIYLYIMLISSLGDLISSDMWSHKLTHDTFFIKSVVICRNALTN